MGIAFSYIRKMEELGLFRQKGMKILDIGSSNLYSAGSQEIVDFLSKHGTSGRPDMAEFAERMSYGSSYDPVNGVRNEAFVGELFESADMYYESFDIVAGYRTTVLDLNHAALPKVLRRKFDLVLNFGTTEHILNQLNCFKVIHDATKVGGYIYHSLPTIGHVDHGYITYTGRFFFDIAGYNNYELVACWFDGPSGGNSVLQSLESYSSYFPVIKTALEQFSKTDQGRALMNLSVPDITINVVYRKIKDKPFLGAFEFSAAVGLIPRVVTTTFVERGAVILQGWPRLYNVAKWVYRKLTGR